MAQRVHILKPQDATFRSAISYPRRAKLDNAVAHTTLLFLDAVDAYAFWDFHCDGYTSGGFDVDIWWSSDGTGTSGNVLWGASFAAQGTENADFHTKGLSSLSTNADAHDGTTDGRLHYHTFNVADGSAINNAADGDVVTVRITRQGANASDTYNSNDVHFVLGRIRYDI